MSRDQRPEKFSPLRSITRLFVGGILLGLDTLEGQLRDWDGRPESEESTSVDGDTQARSQDDPLPDTLPAPQVGKPLQRSTSDMRYALIGVIFEGEESLEKGLSAAKQVGNIALRVTNPLFRPFQKLWKINPAKKSFDRLMERGHSEMDRLVDRGRDEEIQSRQMAQYAATSTVDQSILYMAENEAITELIQTQGVSLAEQILELIRAMSVSADYFFEGLVRYALKQKPRYLLPPPSQNVQEQAPLTPQDIRREEV